MENRIEDETLPENPAGNVKETTLVNFATLKNIMAQIK